MQPVVRSMLFITLLFNMLPTVFAETPAKPVAEQLVDTLTELAGGPHPGFRSNHAKGIVVEGHFTPAASAAEVTKAEIFTAPHPVVVRYSNATGVPNSADNDGNAFPKGIAIRFQLADEASADLVCISVNGFPAATPEEFLGLLQAVAASRDSQAQPKPIEAFLGQHPAALRFVTTPKPVPESFATQPFFGVNAFKFTNAQGETRYGRYRIEPIGGAKFLNADAAKAVDADYLMHELPRRLQQAAYSYRISVQLAEPGDEVNDATSVWPDSRQVVELGTLTIDRFRTDGAAFEKTVMFSPLNLVDGIEASDDPILHARPVAYSISFNRRFQAH